MSAHTFPTSAAQRYDTALRRGRVLSPVPPECPVPRPTSAWPPENVDLLERYRDWLAEGGASRAVIDQHRLPMAGHVLGLALKPHRRLDLEADLARAMAYVRAKRKSAMWERNCGHSLTWFRRFLRQERGIVAPEDLPGAADGAQYRAGLPPWLVEQLEKYLQVRQANWRPSRRAVATYQFWHKHTRLWRWLFLEAGVRRLADITRPLVYAYVDAMLAQGYAPRSINLDLYTFQALLRFLQRRGFAVPAALFSLKALQTPHDLPRFLTDEQLRRVRAAVEEHVEAADTPTRRRDALLDRAAFYLLWQGGLRVCEVEDLALDDLYLAQRRVVVRRGKGLQDRTIYLTAAAVAALEAYLDVRGANRDPLLFLYRNRRMSKDLVRRRIKAAGRRAGVNVTPHMLRHTFGTQLVNAGCQITVIQQLLGHRRLNSTMIYARVHDETAARDYYAAMAAIEARLRPQLGPPDVAEPEGDGQELVPIGDPAYLLTMVAALEAGPLTATQQAGVRQLQHGLQALAEAAQGGAMLQD